MPFHHPAFFALMVLTLAAYWLLSARFQHAVLLIASLAFYYYAGIVDSILLLLVVALNVVLAARIDAPGSNRKRWAVVAVALNLLVLGYWKYRGFVLENLAHAWPSLADDAERASHRVIPLGISFYIFQLIAYQVELARKAVQREPRFWRLLLYILFLPHHQAGPIMRPAKFLPQFYGEKQWAPDLMKRGLLWILMGLAKKCLADQMAPVSDKYFALALDGPLDAWQAWRAALAFGFQIYGDFSGYSDIAVGLGFLFGYRLDVNFKQPYLAANPSDFWKRWHITLSEWLRDYLYIPLGGNRHGRLRTYVNLFATMLLGGIWHGASWMFVVWGAIHGVLLALHRALPVLFAPRVVGTALTFLIVTIAWVPFRATSLAQSANVLSGMFFLNLGPGDTLERWLDQLGWTALVFGAYALEFAVAKNREKLGELWERLAVPIRGTLVACSIAAILLTLSTQSTYVYFRF